MIGKDAVPDKSPQLHTNKMVTGFIASDISFLLQRAFNDAIVMAPQTGSFIGQGVKMHLKFVKNVQCFLFA